MDPSLRWDDERSVGDRLWDNERFLGDRHWDDGRLSEYHRLFIATSAVVRPPASYFTVMVIFSDTTAG